MVPSRSAITEVGEPSPSRHRTGYEPVLITRFAHAVHFNITIDENVHQHLKQELPAKDISRFINGAIRAR